MAMVIRDFAPTDAAAVNALAVAAFEQFRSLYTDWPIMRMLVVSPQARGAGVGRRLAQECIDRAVRDGADVFALHTSPIMSVALPMYERMGFRLVREVQPVLGVAYAVYLKSDLRPS